MKYYCVIRCNSCVNSFRRHVYVSISISGNIVSKALVSQNVCGNNLFSLLLSLFFFLF